MEVAADTFARTMAVDEADLEVVPPASDGLAPTIAAPALDATGSDLMATRVADERSARKLGGGSTELMRTAPWTPRGGGQYPGPPPNLGPPPAPPPPPGYALGPRPVGPGPGAPRAARSSRTGTLVLLLTLPLIGAGAFATWRFRDRIFRGVFGDSSAAPTSSAPAPPGR